MQSIPAITSYLSPSGAGSWDKSASHESLLQETLLEYLNSKPDTITVYGERSADGKVRLPVISFKVAGRDSGEIVQALEQSTNFGFRWGAFYSNSLVNDFWGWAPTG